MDFSRLETVRRTAEPFLQMLTEHPLYECIQTEEDVNKFMEYHVFAVWDFMSLLKTLQVGLTCVQVPWVPVPHARLARLINEIVVEEETDLDERGEVASHFEMYLAAMERCGADTGRIRRFITLIHDGVDVVEALSQADVPQAAAAFVRNTWATVSKGALHAVAGAFTFGREKAIPQMFPKLIEDLAHHSPEKYGALRYYLERHVELDGGSHSILAEEMLAHLCGDQDQKWQETQDAVRAALQARQQLWDGILRVIQSPQLTR